MKIVLNNKYNVGESVFVIGQKPLTVKCDLCSGEKSIISDSKKIRCPQCRGTGNIDHHKYMTWVVLGEAKIKSIKYKKYINGVDAIRYNLYMDKRGRLRRNEKNIFNTIEEAQIACDILNKVVQEGENAEVKQLENKETLEKASIEKENNYVEVMYSKEQQLYTIKKGPSAIKCTLCNEKGEVDVQGMLIQCPACQGAKKVVALYKTFWKPVKNTVHVYRYDVSIGDEISIKYGLTDNVHTFSRKESNIFFTMEDAENMCKKLNNDIVKARN